MGRRRCWRNRPVKTPVLAFSAPPDWSRTPLVGDGSGTNPGRGRERLSPLARSLCVAALFYRGREEIDQSVWNRATCFNLGNWLDCWGSSPSPNCRRGPAPESGRVGQFLASRPCPLAEAQSQLGQLGLAGKFNRNPAGELVDMHIHHFQLEGQAQFVRQRVG